MAKLRSKSARTETCLCEQKNTKFTGWVADCCLPQVLDITQQQIFLITALSFYFCLLLFIEYAYQKPLILITIFLLLLLNSFNFKGYPYLCPRLVDRKDNTEAVFCNHHVCPVWHKGECGPGSVIKKSQSINVSSMFHLK